MIPPNIDSNLLAGQVIYRNFVELHTPWKPLK